MAAPQKRFVSGATRKPRKHVADARLDRSLRETETEADGQDAQKTECNVGAHGDESDGAA
ncbi:hypothetical protein GCM10028820_24320 [Tessaracoccus terricola]